MAARRSLALVVVLATGLLAAPAALAEGPPRVSQRYIIRATLDVGTGRLDAVQVLELTNRSLRPMEHVNLSVLPRALGYLTMDEPVTVDGREVATSWTTSTNLRVPLEGLETDVTVRIRLPFRLDVGRSPGAFTARTSRENGVISFGHWFPIVSTEHDMHGIGDPQVSFTADAIRLELEITTTLGRNAVACPGLVTAPETSGTSWVCESIDVRDFAFVVNPRFRLTTRTAGDTEIRVHTETVDGARTADLAQQGLIGLEEAYGEYPWPDLVLAEVGAIGGFSMEYPRMILLTREKVADPYIVYHEIAHQWFYAQVGNDQQREPWVDEAFADFSARYLMGIDDNACSTRPLDSDVFAWEAGAVTGGDWTSCDGYLHAVLYQGNAFVSEVRAAMGDAAFFGAMREWVVKHRGGFVTGRQLLLHLMRRTDADLLPIYARYLDRWEPPARPWLPTTDGISAIQPILQ